MSAAFKPDIVVLYCGRSLAKNNHLPEGTKKGSGFNTRFTIMPCSSKVETDYLLTLIEQGVDGITLIACPEDLCQFLVGSNRAEGRIRHTRILLDESGMGADRVTMTRRQELSAKDVMDLAAKQAETVLSLGQNPMKS